MPTHNAFTSSTFRIPNLEGTFSVLPDNGINPYHTEVKAESRAWISSYSKTICDPKMLAFIDAYTVCPRASMDQVNLLWLCDEYTDRISKFVRAWIKHTGAEAEHWDRNEVQEVQNYVSLRRNVGALRPCFNLAEHIHGSPYNAAMYLAKELDGTNFITVIMKSKGLDLQGAVNFVGGSCQALVEELERAKEELLACQEEAWADAVHLLIALGDWARGNGVSYPFRRTVRNAKPSTDGASVKRTQKYTKIPPR
ncbi:hypothetical protein DFS33DRAFT_1447570 [Desarmillaria ectypa]|nr:hypothetical protein DFS33DRAFT_1447570 [Desarmillaria ectypa]